MRPFFDIPVQPATPPAAPAAAAIPERFRLHPAVSVGTIALAGWSLHYVCVRAEGGALIFTLGGATIMVAALLAASTALAYAAFRVYGRSLVAANAAFCGTIAFYVVSAVIVSIFAGGLAPQSASAASPAPSTRTQKPGQTPKPAPTQGVRIYSPTKTR